MQILIPEQPTVKEITLKTWDNVTSLDDCILESDRAVIDELKKKIETGEIKLCPFFKREGNYFFYCAKDLTAEELKDNKPSPHNTKYINHVDTAEIQLYCMGRHEACLYFVGKLP